MFYNIKKKKKPDFFSVGGKLRLIWFSVSSDQRVETSM